MVATLLALINQTLPAAVLDFSSPLQNVTVSQIGLGTVTYNVYDPDRGTFVGDSDNTGSVFYLREEHGAVTWSNGGQVFCRIYDPYQGQWIKTNLVSSATDDLGTSHGVVAWSSGPAVNMFVYDAVRTNWIGASVMSGVTYDLRTAHGMVAWSSGTAVYCLAYDPVRGQWVLEPVGPLGGTVSDLTTVEGVAAWSAGGTVYLRTYDPTRTAWARYSLASGSTSDLRTGGQGAAWSHLTTVYYVAYDPRRGVWRDSAAGFPLNTYINNVMVQNGSVSWSANNVNYLRGYNANTGAWSAALTTPYAAFGASTIAGNAPLHVWFFDLSLGASTWSWNFGDGQTSVRRSPQHLFRNYARNVVTLSISGPGGGNASTNLIVITDITPPLGTVLINNGDVFTTNAAVTLQLSATDNSTVVAAMRLSNDASSWSDWEPFSPTTDWTLTTTGGDGTKTVFAQFRDAALNVSTIANDTILLDATQPPAANFEFSQYSVDEGIGSVSIVVQLSHPFNRRAEIDYFTADQSATAGSDYTATSGRLVFAPGVTRLDFSVPILEDATAESDETLTLHLANPTNALAGGSASLTIQDNDQPRLNQPRINSSGQFQATILGGIGQRYLIESSTNLVQWQGFLIRTNATGSVDFVDPRTSDYGARYYRARVSNP